jgi:hypothetical protein
MTASVTVASLDRSSDKGFLHGNSLAYAGIKIGARKGCDFAHYQ